MIRKSGVVGTALSLVLSSFLLSSCAKTCQDKAQNEWMDQQERAIENGASNSISGYFGSLDDYIVKQCGSS